MHPIVRSLSLLGGVCASVALANLAAQEIGAGLEGSRTVEFLLERLEGASDYKVRVAAAVALGKVADGSVADWMLRAFRREENAAVRLAIVYGVGGIPDHRVLAPLIELAQQEMLSEAELTGVERILWNFRGAFHLPSWTQTMLSSPERADRALAAWVIGVTGDRSHLLPLTQALREGSPHVRIRAAQALGKIGGDDARLACVQRLARDPDPLVRKAAENCVAVAQLAGRGQLPKERQHRVDLKTDLFGLQPAIVTPDTYGAYRRKNVNPRAIDVAVASLQPGLAEKREDRSIKLVTREQILQFFRLDATLVTAHRFREVDLNRFRETVRGEAGRVNQCYLEGLKRNAKLGGRITVGFKVARNGSVASAAVEHSELRDAPVQRCIVSKISEIRFGELPVDAVTMRYTYSFVPPKDGKYDFSAD